MVSRMNLTSVAVSRPGAWAGKVQAGGQRPVSTVVESQSGHDGPVYAPSLLPYLKFRFVC
jgi:hypothetical protein